MTCLARGTSGSAPTGTTFISSNRHFPDAYAQVKHDQWDEVIELAYEPELVEGALDALAERSKHWTLVSSVSVYSTNNQPGAAEDATLVEPTDLGAYAHAKVAAEQLTQTAIGERLLIARPGLIAGPSDSSDRFSYWVARLALASTNQVLVPEAAGRYVQYIDVRDLAAWLLDAGLQGRRGTYNVVGSTHNFSDFLSVAAQTANFTGELVAASDKWLKEHGVNYWAGPRSLPLWLPHEDAGFAQRSGERFIAAGGIERSLSQTLEDVLVDERARGLNRVRRSGLSRAHELSLLCSLDESAPSSGCTDWHSE